MNTNSNINISPLWSRCIDKLNVVNHDGVRQDMIMLLNICPEFYEKLKHTENFKVNIRLIAELFRKAGTESDLDICARLYQMNTDPITKEEMQHYYSYLSRKFDEKISQTSSDSQNRATLTKAKHTLESMGKYYQHMDAKSWMADIDEQCKQKDFEGALSGLETMKLAVEARSKVSGKEVNEDEIRLINGKMVEVIMLQMI